MLLVDFSLGDVMSLFKFLNNFKSPGTDSTQTYGRKIGLVKYTCIDEKKN